MMVYEVDLACWGDERLLLMLARERLSAYSGLEGEVCCSPHHEKWMPLFLACDKK
ncbi:hypothetical protein [Pantoea allii]|uniref:hypothetical protein n=1 Tax=Pantoea allii TaxID=574096 RepID=UPI001F4DFC18|nr:hypothetical protein [Pantoea allii]MCH9296369.1 hypothetical protein [Pantoea allii]